MDIMPGPALVMPLPVCWETMLPNTTKSAGDAPPAATVNVHELPASRKLKLPAMMEGILVATVLTTVPSPIAKWPLPFVPITPPIMLIVSPQLEAPDVLVMEPPKRLSVLTHSVPL